MTSFGHASRIVLTAVRFRLDRDVANALPQSARWIWLLPTTWLPRPRTSRAVRLREALESIGPTGVKFGQILSTRQDILAPDYASELARLQSQVPPFDSRAAMQIIEASLGSPTERFFSQLDSEPFASGSLAQVHGGRLLDGSEVVVKVVRPGIADALDQDMKLLEAGARILTAISANARRLRLERIVSDYRSQLFQEIDLRHEARNTRQLRRNFAGSPLLTAPRVYSRLSSRDVLVMQRMRGIPVSNVKELRGRGTDLQKLSRRGLETFFTQVFEHNFFHADMHPGNVLVDVSDPSDPSYIAIDCAVIGALDPSDLEHLARNMLAFFNQNFEEIARLHLESGWVPEDIEVEEFENVLRRLLQPMARKPLSEVSFAGFLFDLFAAARRFNIEIQPQLVLLQRTLVSVEGLGRSLDPDLDLWMTGKPYIEKWIWRRFGPSAIARRLVQNLPAITAVLHKLPEIAANSARDRTMLRRGLRSQSELTERLQRDLGSLRRSRTAFRLVGVAIVLVGVAALFGVVPELEVSSQLPALSKAVSLSAVISGILLAIR